MLSPTSSRSAAGDRRVASSCRASTSTSDTTSERQSERATSAHLFRVHHVLVALPPFPHLAKVKRRHPDVPHDLLRHLADRVHPDVGEEVGERLLWRVVARARVAPVVCGGVVAEGSGPAQSVAVSSRDRQAARTARRPDRPHPVQLAHPHRHARPRLVDVRDDLLEATLPPLDARVRERDFGRQLGDAVLSAEEGQVPHCEVRGRAGGQYVG